jgi:integrase
VPVVDLDAAFVRNVAIPEKGKVDYYSKEITGFILEVRCTGGKTYYLRYQNAHGKKRQVKIGDAKSISFDKAKSAADKLRSRTVLGESPAEDKKTKRAIQTIGEVFRDVYLVYVQDTRRNPESDLSFWRVHLLPRFGSKHLDELKQQDVIEAQLSMPNAGYSTGMANKFVAQIRCMYNLCKKAGIPGSELNPGAGIKQFPVVGRERFLSPEETERLREAVERSENTQLKYIVALLLMLGCRKRELLDARWEHFDLERRTWKIPLSKSGKTRHVPLSLSAVAVLEKLPRWEGCPYVVPNPYTFKPFTGINESWKTALSRAGIGDCCLHTLRHTWASSALMAGAPLIAVSRALGHSSIRMTERYAHLADDTLLAAADAAANTMSKAWSSIVETNPA